jgi:signal transduction histidine kinase
LLVVLSNGTSHRDENALLTLRNGQRLEVALCVAPVHGRTGVSGAVMILRDISSRKMLEMELRQAQKLESVGEMAAGIAHEINTPIQYVGDNIRFLRDSFAELLAAAGTVREGTEAQAPDFEYLCEEVPKAIEQSLEGVERVATIVRAMKHISHPDGDEKSIADINQGITSATTVTRNEWKYCAEVELDLDPELPSIGCYPGALSQVLINLIVNAAHAIDEANRSLGREGKGKILITSRLVGDSIVIKVADDGAGIPESVRHRIFDPFFTTKAVGKGTGQGLALSRSIINQRHGGEISFETEPGAGTTFTIRLPVGGEKPCPVQ